MQRNICKFTAPSLPDTLAVSCFVLETDEATMLCERTLCSNRMLLAVSGKGAIVINGIPLELKAGDLVFAFEGESVVMREPKQLTYLYIDFGGSRADELLHRFGIGKGERLFEGFDGLIPMWTESLSRANEQNIDLATESVLLYTFSRLTGANGKNNELVDRMIELTEEHFKEHEFSLSEVSRLLSYNPKYLSHLFKKKLGVGYSEYLCLLRIKYAITLFDHGIDSIKNVALLSGYTDPLYFSSVFKKHIGVSPKEYIANKK